MVRNKHRREPSPDTVSDESDSPHKNKKSKRCVEADSDNTVLASTSQAARNRTRVENPTAGLSSDFGRCGKIISLRLKNFMCHSNLFIEFGPNINFLVGNNGSGKSAVITALALGLTSSARATSRASSIQKLIKNGETNACIELTISNYGLRPFKFDVYGPAITVVRHIRQSASTYELKNVNKVTVSKKLDDIRRMVLYFGINVENPIFVLNQEASREFLKDLEPAANYRLLMKGTQLDLCASSLTQCHEENEHLNFDLSLMKKKNDTLAKLYRTEEEKLIVVKNKETIKTQLQEANTMLAWLEASRVQEDLNKLEHTLKIIEKKNFELSQKTTQKESTQQMLTEQLKSYDTPKQQILERYQTQEEKLRAAKKTILDLQLKASSIRANIKNAERRLKEEETTYEGCQSRMKNYHSNYAEVKKRKEENAATLQALKATVAECKDQIEKLREEQHVLKNQIPAAKEQVESIMSEMGRLRNSTQSLKYEMESLSRNKSNSMSVYGEQAMKVASVLRAQYLRNENMMPRGPIGMYISVPNPKYRDLIENQLGFCLRSYIVNSDKDRLILRDLLQKSYPNGRIPTIVKSPFTSQVYNVSKNKVRTRTPNTTVIMDEIRCDDPVVMNYLIDVLRIETVLVTDSKDTAESLTSHTENVPPNLTRVLVPNLGLEYSPSPNYAMYSLRIGPARLIQVDVDDRLRQLQAEQLDIKERIERLQPKCGEAQERLTYYNREIQTKNRIINDHNTANANAVQKIMDIENFEYQELPVLELLETHMNNSVKQMEKCKQELEVYVKQLSQIDANKTQAQLEASKEQNTLDSINKKAAEIESESQELENKIRDLDRHNDENLRRLKQTNELLKCTLVNKKDLEKELEKARQKAQEEGDFIEANRSEEKIRDRINRFKIKIKQFESLNINVNEVEQQMAKYQNDLEKTTELYNSIYSVVDNLRISYHKRAQRFQRSRTHLFTMIQFQFQQALACRQFEGNLKPNHKEQTLEISVYPPSGNKTSNTRSLSGGERSFTTVSLLKGLWSTSDHPFYFLDEYDVFTDEVNRTFITKLLIQEGMDFKSRQYCFLTPQDTEVKANKFIRVHKLERPEH
ncbi:structural maintenance of chromosomes protein 6 [Drosophila busckii]|uniref:structural maintenance of chromosomes protein 6 n=1 Tax=Drosophila busckii TaxID=30019 RepID=UPI00083EE7EB|nr:structural maintenance of chromosomes protein 6 [Drosophila busckii]